MSQSDNHKVKGVANMVAATVLAGVFTFSVGSWIVDNDDAVGNDAFGSPNLVVSNGSGDIDELLVYAKNTSMVLSGPLSLFFFGCAHRRFDKANTAKYDEENPNRKPVPYNHEEDLYLRYVHHKESGSGRHLAYSEEDQKRFDARYESGRSQAPEVSELNNS